MDQATVTFWLSAWGAGIATALAILRAYEFYAGRRLRFKVEPKLTTSPEIGNTIVLVNNSALPAHIGYYDLAWVERRSFLGWSIPWTRKVVMDDTPLEAPYFEVETIPPHGTTSLDFSGDHHFDWGNDLEYDIYLRLYPVGRRSPVWLWIAGPSG